jgi:crossover junction endodeoxyribonuclease RusA
MNITTEEYQKYLQRTFRKPREARSPAKAGASTPQLPICLTLPYPPTVNHYYGRGRRGNLFIGTAGKAYRVAVGRAAYLLGATKLVGRIGLHVIACPPDRRRRDLGNLDKCLSDALEHVGLFDDDEQIDDLRYERGERTPGGKLIVKLFPLAGQ